MNSRSKDPLSSLLSRITNARASIPRLIIAIDGRGGAGKSTLARSIAAAIPGAQHFEFDWFHRPQIEITGDQRYDLARLTHEVIDPFRKGQRDFVLKRYNWGYLSGSPDGFADEPIRARDVEVVVLEGCGVLNPTLSEHYDLRIWVDTPPSEALQRGMQRDIEEYGLDPDRVEAAWAEWSAWEQVSLKADDRKLRADIVL